MTIRMQALVRLMSGCRLYYDCPTGTGDNPTANRFFAKHRGKYARLVRYAEKHVGPLSRDGRLPGRYIDQGNVIIRFEGEPEEHFLQVGHFVIVDVGNVTIVAEEGDLRLGDLPHPIEFWPGDVVRFKEGVTRPELFTTNNPRVVNSIFIDRQFLHAGEWGYQLHETDAEHAENAKKGGAFVAVMKIGSNVPAERLELISRGNLWALYNDPAQLVFASFEEEYTFWGQDGIAKRALVKVDDERKFRSVTDAPFHEAVELYEQGHSDIIMATQFHGHRGQERYELWQLHECFAAHRPHVRTLTKRWEHGVKESFAASLAGT